MMETFYRDYLDHLQRLHIEIEKVLDGLPQAALDWVPGEGMNSLGVLAYHVAGAERFWIGDFIAGDPSDRDREAEFLTQGVGVEPLKKRLSASLSYIPGVLEGLSAEELHATRVSPRDGQVFSVGWALAHALEHTAIHLGHMQVTRQIWEQEHG